MNLHGHFADIFGNVMFVLIISVLITHPAFYAYSAEQIISQEKLSNNISIESI